MKEGAERQGGRESSSQKILSKSVYVIVFLSKSTSRIICVIISSLFLVYKESEEALVVRNLEKKNLHSPYLQIV